MKFMLCKPGTTGKDKAKLPRSRQRSTRDLGIARAANVESDLLWLTSGSALVRVLPYAILHTVLPMCVLLYGSNA